MAKDNYATAVNVTVKSGVTWNLSANTTLDALVVEEGATVNTNGYTLTASTTTNNGTIVNGLNAVTVDAATDGAVYNLRGTKERTDGKLEGLARGVYVKGGKKLLKP